MKIASICFNKISFPQNKQKNCRVFNDMPHDSVSFGATRKFSGDVNEPTLQGSLMDREKYQTRNDVFDYFDLKKTSINKNGRIVLSSYHQPSPDFTFSDLDINEHSLLGRVVGISGDADFRKSKITSTRHITRIGGNCNMTRSSVKKIPALEYIGGDFDAEFNSLESLGALRIICGNANLGFGNLKNLGVLKYVDGDLDLTGNYNLESLGTVKSVGGNLYISDTNIVKADNLQNVGGNVYLRQDQLDKMAENLPKNVLDKCIITSMEDDE